MRRGVWGISLQESGPQRVQRSWEQALPAWGGRRAGPALGEGQSVGLVPACHTLVLILSQPWKVALLSFKIKPSPIYPLVL